MSNLTAKQEKFVQNIVKGMSQREAYKKSYSAKNMSDNSIDCEASKLFSSPKVTQRYNELIEKLEKSTIMSAQERMEYLTRVIQGKEKDDKVVVADGIPITYGVPADLNIKLKALDQLNKMTGEYITKVEADVSVTKLEDLL